MVTPRLHRPRLSGYTGGEVTGTGVGEASVRPASLSGRGVTTVRTEGTQRVPHEGVVQSADYMCRTAGNVNIAKRRRRLKADA